MNAKQKGWIFIICGGLITGILCLSEYLERNATLWKSMKDPETIKQLQQFVAWEEAEARAATNRMAPEVKAVFKYAKRGDWLSTSNSFSVLLDRKYPEGVRQGGVLREMVGNLVSKIEDKAGWYPSPTPERLDLFELPSVAATEVKGSLEAFGAGEEKYSIAFGRDIIASVPPGSIYFGGSNPGRFIIPALSFSSSGKSRFFAADLNSLTDEQYLKILKDMYGSTIDIPTTNDIEKCRWDFSHSIQSDLRKARDGEQIPDQNPALAVNGALAKLIIERASQREIFVEEGFPIVWMYPQLEPHGLIFKLNRQPNAELPDEVVRRDHEYWSNYVQPIIGDWLRDNTTIAEVAAFSKKTYGMLDFKGFKGDPSYIQNDYSQKMFSKLRSAIAGLYDWRAGHSTDAQDRERMMREADFAFRQAWALGPDSTETVCRYINFLIAASRVNDAVVVDDTALSIVRMKNENDGMLEEMLKYLKEMQGQSRAAASSY